MRRLGLATSALVALLMASLMAQSAATTRIAGRVVDDANRGVRGALVMVAGTDVAVSRVTAADDDGRFVFDGVPKGHVLVVAGKPAYIAALAGAAHAGRPGQLFLVGTDRTADLTVALQRGGSISGHVLDASGLPVVGARVRVGPRRQVGPSITIGGDVGEPSAPVTDDTGAFHVFDLAPGDYVVGVAARGFAAGDVKFPGQPESAPPPSPQGASVGFAPAYYPAAGTIEEAGVVTIGPGVDKDAIDIKTSVVRFGRIDGLLSGIDGVVPPHQIQLRPKGWTASGSFLVAQTTRAGTDGKFTFANVPPGAYTIVARTIPPPPDPMSGAERRPPVIWSMSDVTMTGADAQVVLRWQGALSVSGHVTFAGLAHPPNDITIRIGVRPTAASAGPPLPDTVPVSADGSFTISGVMPGDYWLYVQVPASPATQLPDWIPGSAMIDGKDAFDQPFPVRAELGTPDIPVVLTQETQQIDGAVHDGLSHPVVDCPVIVFSTDRKFWFPQSRRIALRRTDPNGGMLFNLGAALPPGEYFVAVVPDLQPNEQFDPAVLAEAATKAHRVSIAAGGSTTVQLRLARTP